VLAFEVGKISVSSHGLWLDVMSVTLHSTTASLTIAFCQIVSRRKRKVLAYIDLEGVERQMLEKSDDKRAKTLNLKTIVK
jgi:hypothetical protein